ncbi:MAG: UDP-N-acetylmuramate dehydrogenase [Planctomycetes bacterium]|nr:UDP-N-acetylmuramate dehydrogenase [Planctomycetota bacterium]
MTDDTLALALRSIQGVVRTQFALAPLTHVRIGGPAEFFVEPWSERDVATVVRACKDLDVPLHVLGGGSNVLIPDEGVRGVVMQLASLNRIVRDGDRVTAGAGVSLATLMRGVRTEGLAGLEQLCGIPAHVGGAVAMNAGTKDGETFDTLVSLTVVDADGEIRVLGKDDFHPSYRNGGLGDQIVVHATFELREDSPKAIYDRFEASLKARNASQPVTERSLGCVFTNPGTGSAGQLIEAAGCKLMHEGGVSVSGKHANYFVNDGTGTAADFRRLMDRVVARVKQDAHVELTAEIKLW